jgi:hypothetical protein
MPFLKRQANDRLLEGIDPGARLEFAAPKFDLSLYVKYLGARLA